MKWELMEPVVEVNCSPTEEDLNSCRLLGSLIARRLRP